MNSKPDYARESGASAFNRYPTATEVNCQPRRTDTTEYLLTELRSSAEALHDTIALLEGKYDPVMKPCCPSPASPPEDPGVNSDLNRHIHELNATIRAAQRRVEDVCSRCAL